MSKGLLEVELVGVELVAFAEDVLPAWSRFFLKHALAW
jgi:hypothetical protein